MIVMDAKQAAIATYQVRKATLEQEARDDEKARRPIRAAYKRQAARRLTLAIVSEEIDSLPTGIVRDDCEECRDATAQFEADRDERKPE